jgi:hypothetical protein
MTDDEEFEKQVKEWGTDRIRADYERDPEAVKKELGKAGIPYGEKKRDIPVISDDEARKELGEEEVKFDREAEMERIEKEIHEKAEYDAAKARYKREQRAKNTDTSVLKKASSSLYNYLTTPFSATKDAIKEVPKAVKELPKEFSDEAKYALGLAIGGSKYAFGATKHKLGEIKSEREYTKQTDKFLSYGVEEKDIKTYNELKRHYNLLKSTGLGDSAEAEDDKIKMKELLRDFYIKKKKTEIENLKLKEEKLNELKKIKAWEKILGKEDTTKATQLKSLMDQQVPKLSGFKMGIPSGMGIDPTGFRGGSIDLSPHVRGVRLTQQNQAVPPQLTPNVRQIQLAEQTRNFISQKKALKEYEKQQAALNRQRQQDELKRLFIHPSRRQAVMEQGGVIPQRTDLNVRKPGVKGFATPSVNFKNLDVIMPKTNVSLGVPALKMAGLYTPTRGKSDKKMPIIRQSTKSKKISFEANIKKMISPTLTLGQTHRSKVFNSPVCRIDAFAKSALNNSQTAHTGRKFGLDIAKPNINIKLFRKKKRKGVK